MGMNPCMGVWMKIDLKFLCVTFDVIDLISLWIKSTMFSSDFFKRVGLLKIIFDTDNHLILEMMVIFTFHQLCGWPYWIN